MITDEMVEKALEAAEDAYPESKRSDMRAALEAVAPMLIADYQRSPNVLRDAYDAQAERFAVERPKLIAQGLLEAAGICGDYAGEMADELKDAILARAQELDPQ